MSRAKTNIKVGVFVLIGLVFTGLVVFLIGDERRVFDTKVDFTATFYDVQGLKQGAPLRLGGVDVGHVSEVSYPDDPTDPKITVTIGVVRNLAPRIKENHVLRIVGKGFLGDKMIILDQRTREECLADPACRDKFIGRRTLADCRTDQACARHMLSEATWEDCAGKESCRKSLPGSSWLDCSRDEGCAAKLLAVTWQACQASESCQLQHGYRPTGKLVALGEPVYPGSTTLRSAEPDDLFGQVEGFAREAESTMESARTAMSEISGVAKDLRANNLPNIDRTVSSFGRVMDKVADDQGYDHLLLSSDAEAKRISETVDSLNHTAKELSATLAEIRLTVNQVRTGPGFAHDMLFGPGPRQEIAQLGDAANELALTLKGVREGQGFAHDVLFGGQGDGSDALSNLSQITADVRDIVRGVKEGKGTFGALLVDPSIYEDLKRVLGNVERNNVLRALVRYSIKQDQKPPAVEVSAPDK